MTQKKTDVKRYDRQIRLWGEEGQELLQNARICLINANATGTETLKNLILPGIGHFMIVDDKKVVEADLGTNFFVTINDVGRSRAQVTCELLQELNCSDADDIFAPQGKFDERNPETLVEQNIEFFSQFTLVIVTEMSQKNLLKLASFCWDKNIKLFIVKSYGFIGYLRIIDPEHTIVQSKPDTPPDDLRLNEPWEELKRHAHSFDLNTMESSDHSHVPFIVILLQQLEKWKKEHGGKLPQNYEEKKMFKNKILQEKKVPDEVNFEEAFRSAHKAYSPTTIPNEIKKLFDDPKCNVTSNSDTFWIVVSAIKEFVQNEGEGFLPLAGSIPDMTATTKNYVSIQHVYREKANKDFQAVLERVKALLRKCGREPNSIPEETVKIFCKNARFLNVLRYRSLEEEYSNLSDDTRKLYQERNSNIFWYIMLRAVSQFQTTFGRYPGDTNENFAKDLPHLEKCVYDLVESMNLDKSLMEERYIKEMLRYGGAELHNIASLMGGIASEEVIKIVTHQYVPLNNSLIVNGIYSTSLTFIA